MFCRKCGKEIEHDHSRCPYCGADVIPSAGLKQKFTSNQPVVNNNGATNYSNTTNYGNTSNNNVFDINQNQGTYPMKWYKFLIFFLLWFSAVLNAVTGLGNFFGGFAALEFVAWGLIDSVLGAAQVALAIFIVITRNKLAGFKQDAPDCLYKMYIFSCALTVGYSILVGLFTGFGYFNFGNLAGDVIATVVMIVLNKKYFEKRRSLFVNM